MKSINNFLKTICIVIICLLPLKSFSANFYWVGGTGTWSDYAHHWATQSGGQIYWAHVPTPTDTVIFDSLSFTGIHDTVIANNNVYCHTMKWMTSDSLPLFIHSGNQPILRIYGSLLIDSTTQWNYHGKIIFCAIATGNTIQTSGAQLYYVNMRGDTAASWTLEDTLRAEWLVFTSGNFYSQGQTIITNIYEQAQSNLSRQFLDTSIVYCNRWRNHANPVQLDADSATIVVTGDSLEGGSLHYHKVVLQRHAGISGNNTIDTCLIHSNADVFGNNIVGTFISTRAGVIVSLVGNLTIVDTMIFNGACSGMSALTGSGSINFLSPGLVLQTIFVDGISATGNPTANNSVVQNAPGWGTTNNPVPRTLYWVNGQGSWSDPSHWSSTSGGIGNECSPTPIDAVNFDANSFTQTNEVTNADNHITLFADMQWTGLNNAPIIVQDTGYAMGFGDLKLQCSVGWNVSEIMLRSANPNTVIDIQNNNLLTAILTGSGSFVQQSPVHAINYIIDGGDYTSNGLPIDAYAVSSNSITGNRNFSGSSVHASRWVVGLSGGVFTAPDSITTNYLYDLNTNNYNTVYAPASLSMKSNSTYSTFEVSGSATIDGNSTFDTLRFTGNDIAIVLHPTTTQTITGDLQINSDCSMPATVKTNTPGSVAYISKASGVINCDYLILEDIHAIGGGTFNATNTCALQNVSGWNVTPPPAIPMFWIGGTGNWKDPLHWSYTSGGPAAGCIPNPLTDVYFDGLSFTSNGQTVNMNAVNGYCHNLDWTSSTGSPSFISPSQQNRMNCFGSMILEQGVTTYGLNIFMRAQTTGNLIDPKNATIGNLILDGNGGSWSLQDSMGCDTIQLTTGILYTNGNSIDARVFSSSGNVNRELYLDSSAVTTGSWQMDNNLNLILDASQATISADADVFQGGNHLYKEVVLNNEVALTDPNTYSVLRVRGSVSILGTQHIDSLFLEAGGDMIRLSSDTIFVDSSIIANSNSSSYIGIQAESPIDHAYISMATDTVCIDYMILQGIEAMGGATFYAGVSSSDVADNSGWIWQTCSGMVTVWPGDANYDLTANNSDILSIGVAFGETGGQRANASLNWIAQPNYQWNRVFADSTDIVHADCDGDGVVGYTDTNAVSLNYGQTHPARYAAPVDVETIGAEIKLVVTQAAFQPGDTVEIPIWLGTQSSPLVNGYGIAFTLNWDQPFVEPGSLQFVYANSWFSPGTTLHLEKPFYSSQYCDLGVSRINHADTSGSGELVLMRFVLTQNANGPLKFWFTNYEMIDHNEDTLSMFSTGGTINAAVGIDEYNPQEISAYPNPTNGYFAINTSLIGPGIVRMYDVAGRIVLEQEVSNAASTSLDASAVEAGYYFLIVETETGFAQMRIQKL